MTEHTRKKADSVTIVWEDGEEETLKVGDEGDIFVVLASKEKDHYASVWSGGFALFQSVMASAVQFRARLHVKRVHDEDRRMVDQFIQDALGGEDE